MKSFDTWFKETTGFTPNDFAGLGGTAPTIVVERRCAWDAAVEAMANQSKDTERALREVLVVLEETIPYIKGHRWDRATWNEAIQQWSENLR